MEVKWVRDGVLVGEGWMAYLSGIVSKLGSQDAACEPKNIYERRP